MSMDRGDLPAEECPDGRPPRCPGCGYDLRGLRGGTCPECGVGTFEGIRKVRLSPGVAAADLLGIGVAVGVNAVFAAVTAVAVMAFGKGSWFTDPRFNLGGRGPQSVSGVLLIVLAASLMVWGLAWERTGPTSWRIQIAAAIWCLLLTLFHAVGLASVLI